MDDNNIKTSKIIQQIYSLSEELMEYNIYMGGKDFYHVLDESKERELIYNNKNLYLAISLKSKEKCVIEFAPSDLEYNELQKYFRKALLLYALEHEKGLITAKDFSIDPTRAFIVLDWVPGKSLYEKIKYKSLDIKEALWILLDMTHALEHLAELGLVHRNISPQSIIIKNTNGRAYLGNIDYLNISEFLQTKKLNISAHYASPELINSLIYNEPVYLTPYSDIYSLGAVFFHMITGIPPNSPSNNLLNNIFFPPYKIPRDIPLKKDDRKFCEKLLKNMMNLNPLKRWNHTKIRLYIMQYLKKSDRREDMKKWLI